MTGDYLALGEKEGGGKTTQSNYYRQKLLDI